MSYSILFHFLVYVMVTGSLQAGDKLCQPRFWEMTRGDTNVCLYFHKKAEDFSEARKICKSMNAHIITPKTSGEFHILSWINKQQWVGLDDLEVEGQYIWHDDNSTMDENFRDAHFFPGEPSKSGQEDCIQYVPSREKFNSQLLTDCQCDLERPFFCEHS